MRSKHLDALLLLDQFAESVAEALREHEVVEGTARRANCVARGVRSGKMLGRHGRCGSQRVFETLGEDVVLLDTLLGH